MSPPSAIVLNSNGEVAMIVHPDFEEQLQDSAFNPPGMVQVAVSPEQYQAIKSERDVLVLVHPAVAQKDADIADKVSLKIQAIDHADVAIVATKALPVPQEVQDASSVIVAQRLRFLDALALDKTLDFTIWAIKQDAPNAKNVAAAQASLDQQKVIIDQAVSAAKSDYDAQFAADPIAARASLDAQLATAAVAIS